MADQILALPTPYRPQIMPASALPLTGLHIAPRSLSSSSSGLLTNIPDSHLSCAFSCLGPEPRNPLPKLHVPPRISKPKLAGDTHPSEGRLGILPLPPNSLPSQFPTGYKWDGAVFHASSPALCLLLRCVSAGVVGFRFHKGWLGCGLKNERRSYCDICDSETEIPQIRSTVADERNLFSLMVNPRNSLSQSRRIGPGAGWLPHHRAGGGSRPTARWHLQRRPSGPSGRPWDWRWQPSTLHTLSASRRLTVRRPARRAPTAQHFFPVHGMSRRPDALFTERPEPRVGIPAWEGVQGRPLSLSRDVLATQSHRDTVRAHRHTARSQMSWDPPEPPTAPSGIPSPPLPKPTQPGLPPASEGDAGDTSEGTLPRRSQSVAWQLSADRHEDCRCLYLTMGPWKLLSALSILSAAYADMSLFHSRARVMSERIHNTCFFWGSAKDPSILSLAQSGNVAILEKTLKTHKHIYQSEFDLRTLDPEGLVFYGDTEGSVNWFILGLRNGRPEIQLSNQYCQTVVSSGDVLNDGRWRTITVQSDRRNIKLLVDGKPSLIITVLPNIGLEGNLIDMRITMGHLLINESSLLIPLKDRLDACITNWDWLQQNTSWLAKEVASNPNIQCPTNIMPGTFFPGMGTATFKTSGFQNDSESQEDWSLRFEALIRPSKHSGVVLAILSQTYIPLLQLDFVQKNRQEQFRLKLGGSTLVQLPGPSLLCEGQRVTISLSASKVSLHIGGQSRSRPVTQDTIATLRTAWFDGEALLFLGGLPALDTLGYDWFYFQGCMQELKVQGVSVDLNQAFFVHEAISTHSCPAVKFSQSHHL
ncbi:sex hormone-binding globulin [Pristis pectinata]|uniref:sex hormone-binding globulin n=1 Tax=Pristis pectinata TaxID=685728 RepID=UPI00223E1814|nr:sex hormone-binding globulin [Pristis pectinata]